jgi:hypothetical protein
VTCEVVTVERAKLKRQRTEIFESLIPQRREGRDAEILMPTTNRYSIEIKDVTGKTLVFINADWTDDEARAAVAQILRLASRPDESYLIKPPEPNRN